MQLSWFEVLFISSISCSVHCSLDENSEPHFQLTQTYLTPLKLLDFLPKQVMWYLTSP